MNYLRISVSLLTALLLAGCGPVVEVSDSNEIQAYLLAKPPSKPSSLAKDLRLLVREGTFRPDVLDHFEKIYGITLTVDTYPDAHGLLSGITPDLSEYDLVMLTDYQLDLYLQQTKFAALNTTNIPNLKQVKVPFHAVDYSSNQPYSVPFAQDVLGMAFNIRELSHFPRTWSLLKDRENPSRLKGKVAIPATPRLLYGATMILLNLDPNSIDPADISAATESIKTLAEFEPTFDDDVHEALVSGELLLALDYGSDLSRVIEQNSNIRMILPDGGAVARVFTLAVPASSSKQETAEFLINYMLIPEVAASNTNYSHLASTIQEVGPYLESRVHNGPSYLQPPYGDLLHTLTPLGPNEQLYEDAQSEIKALLDKQNPVLFNSGSGPVNPD